MFVCLFVSQNRLPISVMCSVLPYAKPTHKLADAIFCSLPTKKKKNNRQRSGYVSQITTSEFTFMVIFSPCRKPHAKNFYISNTSSLKLL